MNILSQSKKRVQINIFIAIKEASANEHLIAIKEASANEHFIAIKEASANKHFYRNQTFFNSNDIV